MVGDFISAVSGTVAILMLVGGAVYSLGVVFHLWERLKFHNAIWHLLVLAGAGCHYAAVLISVALGHGPA